MPKQGYWYTCLFDALKREAYVHFETTIGVKRSGKLTGVKTNTVKINGSKKKVIYAFVLNYDSTDIITFSDCVSIDIDEEHEDEEYEDGEE